MPETVELNDEAKAYIVKELACWAPPAEVVKGVKEHFGLEISRQRVEGYNPFRSAGANLSEKWVTLFNDTRKKFRDETADIGITDKTIRLRMLERGARHFEAAGNYLAMKEMLEACAKEMGDAFTNKQKHEHSGKVDVPLAATIVFTGAPAGASAPEAVGSVPHKSD